MKIQLGRWLPWVILSISFPTFADDVLFDGTLVEDACEVYPGDENIELDFGTVIDEYLYLNTRTNSQPFTIRLINCDLVLGKEVQVTFTGNESTTLPGLLALNNVSHAKGIAVGLESANGTPIKLNKMKGHIQGLHSGNGNNLNFKAYIQGEPKALQEKNIILGDFVATTTFTLEYE
ncbi:type 1 fimbrial protein [Providencia rettgeri]|uniref:Type 1 fimbrial protein n=1 Tax=Providencia rettgeri TaxID=587 RepID=A0AAE2XHG7_PRORE|nr:MULTISPECIES: fimbrial protein [Providencia]EJD6080123.1 type 1 fimbrial protein [Providencia rettgeri]EJD6601529.1 type 1 fimbrial protein [Providencia rettgeri]ELR5225873.1 type 1 fimbrial protein [Providencia rettgeri]MBQ0209263.1 type 1 fimbrial protein [Providencia rettgeri]MBQ0328995.1 type 1 fimbrial protein [Providencia rettgeri]